MNSAASRGAAEQDLRERDLTGCLELVAICLVEVARRHPGHRSHTWRFSALFL